MAYTKRPEKGGTNEKRSQTHEVNQAHERDTSNHVYNFDQLRENRDTPHQPLLP